MTAGVKVRRPLADATRSATNYIGHTLIASAHIGRMHNSCRNGVRRFKGYAPGLPFVGRSEDRPALSGGNECRLKCRNLPLEAA